MTLVQSLRQLLSGNNIIVCLFLSVVISSCGTRQISGIQKTEVVPITPKKKNITSAQEDSVTRKPSAIDIENPVVPKTEGGKIYNVAVILPFFLDQIALNVYADDTTKILSA